MTERSLTVAVVGCGALARSLHLPNIVANGRLVLHTCCDLSETALAECRDNFKPIHTCNDYREVAADPEVDVVVLATTEKLRLPVIAACADAGKPVYVEKPLAASLDALYAIQRVVQAADLPVCVGHNRRCAPAMVEARALYHRHLADPQSFPWRYDREGPDHRPALADAGATAMSVQINDDWYSWKGWVFDKSQAPYGPLVFEMTHFTDLCNWIIASDPVEVVALGSDMLNHGVVIRYAQGQLATITMGSNGSMGYPKERYEISGAGATVVIEHMVEIRTAGIPGAPLHKIYPLLGDRHPQIGSEGGLLGWLAKKQAACAEAVKRGDPLRSFSAEPDKGHARAIDRFVDEIRGAGPKVCPVEDAVLATRVAFAAVRSVQTGRAVKLEEI